MCVDDNKNIIAYCTYCKNPIYEGEGVICVNGKYYHYSKELDVNNCYFVEEEETE